MMPNPASGVILIVEDSPRISALIVSVLSDLPYQMLTAASVQAATEQVENHMERIRLLVIDYNLPDGNGLEIAAKARALKPSVPVLMMSGYPISDSDVVFLQKPFDPTELLELVESMVS